MKRFSFYVLTVWIGLWAQVLHNYYLGGSRLHVDLILIGVLYFGLLRGPLVGQTLGFVWGLLIDASSLGLMGLHILLYASAGYAAGMLRRQLDETQPFSQAIFTFVVSLGSGGGYAVLDHVFSSAERTIGWALVFQPFVNALLAPALFWFLRRWSEGWHLFPEAR